MHAPKPLSETDHQRYHHPPEENGEELKMYTRCT